MGKIIKEDDLKKMSDEELSEIIKDQGVFLYMHDGSMNEARIKDVMGTDNFNSKVIDYTGLSFFRQTIREIEVISEEGTPNIDLV